MRVRDTSTDAVTDDPEAIVPVECYGLCHDGWLGILILSTADGGGRAGTFLQLRDGRVHVVEGLCPLEDPSSITLVIHRFGQAKSQTFRGRRIGPREEAIAGVTLWRDVPFGFYARRSPLLFVSNYGMQNDRVDDSDVLGSFTIWYGAELGTVHVWKTARGLRGRLLDRDGQEWPVEVHFGGSYNHQLTVSFATKLGTFVGTGYVFTHTKNGAAGFAAWNGRESAFYMIRTRATDQ